MTGRKIAVALLVPLLAALASLPLVHWETDFLSFYAGARLAGAGQLYSLNAVHQIEAEYEREPAQVRAYIRPAFYALLLWPLGKLPFRAASVAWQVLNVAAIGIFIWIWRRDRAVTIVLFMPLLIALALGQDVPIFLAVFAGVVCLLRKNRLFLAGLVMALCAVKFHLFLLLPLVVVAKRLWRFAGGLAAGGTVLAGLSFLVYGNWVPAFLAMLRMNEEHQNSQTYMVSIAGLLWRAPHAALWIASVFLAAAVALWFGIRKAAVDEAMALALLAGVLLSMHAFIYDLGFLLPWITLQKPERAVQYTVAVSVAILAVAFQVPYAGPLLILSASGWEIGRNMRSGAALFPAPAAN
ncbi:MAG TPA: glycosyltransferase family 87 protein [Bryobacteraceae bacterium]|nr:glycosyltransferase family 87 protein [Bryobacteraceae bacterium]